LQGAKRYLITACNTLLFSRIFSILHAVSNPLLHTAKRNPIPFRPETKGGGQVTLSNNVTSVIACALHVTILYLSLKINKKNSENTERKCICLD
jgi:hypothetical protein